MKTKFLLFSLMLSFLSITNVWGYTITFSKGSGDGSTASTTTACSAIVSEGAPYLSGNLVTATKAYYNGSDGLKLGASSNAGTIKMNLASNVTPTSIVVSAKRYNASKAVTLKVNGSTAQNITADFSDLTFSISSEISYIQLESSKYCWIESITVNTSSADPAISVSPASWDFENVAVSAEASKVFSVSGSNLKSGQNLSITVPEGYSVSPNNITISSATLSETNVTVSKNTNTIGTYNGNMSISGGGQTSAKTVALKMNVIADPEPTGTFELFSGDLEEGDYVVVFDGIAMTNTVASNRLANTDVTISSNKISNPPTSIIWHLAPSSSYWTFYNDEVEKYAASTGTKNQATLATTEDAKIMWTVEESNGVYHFNNRHNSDPLVNVNSKLQRNSTYGWACYAAYSDIQLYKKSDGKPSAPSFSPASGKYLEAQSVTLTTSTEGATIHYTLDGTTPTSESATYSTALNISATTTIKAVAIKDEVSSSVSSATYEIVTPQSVDEIWDEITAGGPEDAYVYGYVSQTNVGGYENNFYISVDGSTEGNQLYAYRMDMNSYSVAVGDKVILNGDLTIYNNVKEFKYTSATDCGKIISVTPKGALQSVAVSGTPTKTVYANGETFEPAGLDVTATYANGFATAVTADSWECTPATVTASGNISVKATYESVQSLAYSVPVTVASKTLVSIALSYDAVDVYQGLELPKPIVTATYSEGQPEDVTAQAEFAGYDASTTGEQEITVSYTFGGTTKTATYTVTVNPIFNVELAASVARNLIINVVGNTESTDDMIIRGKVSYINNASSNAQTYWISDDGTRTNEVEIFKGKYLSGADFTSANQLRVGDEVVVIGKVIYYNNSTPEFANGKSEVQSLARTPNFTITDVTEFEVGATDLAVADLTVTVEGEGAITLVSGDETKATIVSNAIHAVAPGTVTITANLAADGIYKAATTTFNVTVIATQTKYAVSFDGNGADGGTAPEAIANQVEGASVTLPENTWTKTNKLFDGWKVINNTTFAEITVTAGAFTMPASTVTIQAQWADPSVWALTYTSNLTLTGNSSTKAYAEKVKITVNEVLTEFDALRACTGSAAGSCTVTVPAGTQKLHFHAAAWNAKTSTITVTMGETELLVQALAADAGIKNSSPYTLEGIPYMYYYCIDLSSYTLSDETTITFAAGSDKRFVLFGVNQEGGVVPVLQSIAIDGDMTNKTGYKAGDQLDMAGLTVSATYTLGGTAQTPVDITNDPGLSWTYDPIVEGQTSVTVTANFGGETAEKTIIGLEVASADPKIYVSSTKAEFGTVAPNATVNPIAITVTLTNVAAATATLGGTNPTAFSIDKTALTASGDITISVVSTATEGSYSATLTISDDATENPAQSKVVNISLKVETTETPISTASRWEVATASDIADGLEVLITGVKGENTYAMGSQTNNNRTAIEASIDNEGVLTPGEGTMSFILEAQGEGKYALRTSNGKYLYAASNSSNHLKTEDALDAKNNGLWAIAYENNEWSIVAQGENGHNIMRFNENNSIFSCYASGQSPVQLYKKAPIAPEVVDVTGSEAVSNIPEGSEVTVEDGGELTVDTKNTFAKLIVKEGGKVTLSNKKLTVTGTFTIETTMAGGKSGQLKGATQSNFIAQADAYIDITLGDNGNADKWHAFTVPFPVDALNGIFDLDGNKLTNEQNYAIMDYHGDIRAQGKYGWKKFRGTLVPGTFYLMTVDGLRTTYRMKMKAGSNVVADNKKDFYKYAASGEGQATDAGWNGIGNPTLAYGQVNVAVQVLDPVHYVYETKNANSCNFIVGTPFFYQAAIGGEITIMGEDNEKPYYAPIRKAVKTTEQIKVSLANENYTDNLFISASEDATNNYQIGKDLVKMTMTNTPIVPQIFGVAYKTQLSMVHAPLVGDRANYTLNLYAPADGEYTISAQQTEDAIVYLTYEGSPIWNITAGEYNCDLQKGNNSGFGLMLVRRAPQVTTDIEGANQSQTGVRKLLINGQLFIEKEGKLFNVTGQRL